MSTEVLVSIGVPVSTLDWVSNWALVSELEDVSTSGGMSPVSMTGGGSSSMLAHPDNRPNVAVVVMDTNRRLVGEFGSVMAVGSLTGSLFALDVK